MNQREKVLAIAVGTLGVLLGGQYGWTSIKKGLQIKQAQVDKLTKDVEDKQFIVDEGDFARGKLEKLKPSSLPKDDQLARKQYIEWLDAMAHSVFTNPLVSKKEPLPIDGAYMKYQFEIGAVANLDQILSFLGKFYEKNYLHRLKDLKIAAIPASSELRMTSTIEVIALVDANMKQDPPSSPAKKLAKKPEEYAASIIRRNIFGPENQAPKLVSSKKERVEIGKSAEGTVKADDPDEGQSIAYEFVGEAPANAELDNKTGRWKFTPPEKGTYTLLVRAVDSGFPAKVAEQKIEIEVIDPAPPAAPVATKPKFDPASQIFITGIVKGRKGSEVWLFSRVENQTTNASVGDQIELGQVKGTLVEIGKDFIVVETEGRRWTAGMDESLAEAFKRSADD
jgi:hypothetical protein